MDDLALGTVILVVLVLAAGWVVGNVLRMASEKRRSEAALERAAMRATRSGGKSGRPRGRRLVRRRTGSASRRKSKPAPKRARRR